MQGSFLYGKRQGLWITYSEAGNKLTEVHYKDDQLNGVYIVYDVNGTVVQRLNYRNDALVN